MTFVEALLSSDIFRITVKLLLSLILTGSIGLERSVMNKPAGFGTHAILGVSSCLIVIASEYFANFYDIDAARIPAQILAGIGFIGAGTIMKNGYNVKGITTAAGLFAVTCIGIAVGIGFYAGACLATFIIFLLLSYSHSISDKIGKYEMIDLDVTLDTEKDGKVAIKKINEYLKSKHIDIVSVSNNANVKDGKVIQYILNYNVQLTDKSEILATLMSYDELVKVEINDD
jgi:putative Mg2+ transporter-C (MgtC) family protein